MEPRRLNLLDALILTAAVALGLGAARWWFDQPGFINPAALHVREITSLVAWVLLPTSIAGFLIRLRPPRPERRRMVRQPGFQAGLLVSLATVATVLNNGWAFSPILAALPFAIGNLQVEAVAPTVAIGWTLAWLLGARRREPGPIDRLGRALGWAWIVVWVAYVALDPLPPLSVVPPSPLSIPTVPASRDQFLSP